MNLKPLRRWAVLAGIAVTAALPAPAYYHFIHYLNAGEAPEKFDLTALPESTVTFLVSEKGPSAYSAGDSPGSVIGQIRQAAAIWNGVSTSALRVAFGGFESNNTLQNAPGGDVVFDDLPPGVEGMAGPTSRVDPVTAADGTVFVPIVRSVIYLNRNMTFAPGPSYNQSFLMTMLHEMGHALGLQHTFTSSTMSQDTTRATSLTHPLDNDDIAGISTLYPAGGFAQFGSITGHVTAGGVGVHMASVVAIRNGVGAVSAVTNPDGAYRIDGIPAGTYTVYVQSMPPDANILGPWNADGSLAPASGPISTLFYPGTTDINQARALTVASGKSVDGIDIVVRGRDSVPFYDGQIFGFPGSVPVRPAPVNLSGASLTTVAASVVGLGSNGTVPGLSVQVPGNAVALTATGVRPYLASNGYTYVALDLLPNPYAPAEPQHLIFSTPDYTYVLPSAMNLTQSAPPSLTSVAVNADGTLTVSGTNWAPGTLFYFDSLPATVLSLDTAKGIAIVTPPEGANAQTATLTVYTPDGQNSQFIPPASPVTYSYGTLQTPSITAISPTALPAGAEAMVDITGSGFNFVQGLTTIGFGTSDIVVHRVFVLSPNHLIADVAVAANAALSIPDVSVFSGFQFATAPAAFQINPPVTGLPEPFPALFNALAGEGITGAYPGAIVSLYGKNLAVPDLKTSTITIAGQPVQILYWSPTQINLQVPAALPPGPALMAVNNGLLDGYPVAINIDPQPAGFSAVQNSTGAYISPDLAAHQGDTLIATMNHFAPAGTTAIAPGRVQISLGGVQHPALTIAAYGDIWQITFQVGPDDPVGQAETLIVYLDGLSSLPATIQVAHPDGSFTP